MSLNFVIPEINIGGGTGTFTAGADVVVPSPTNPIDIVCNNGAIKVKKVEENNNSN